jgi:hypothetical protein
MGLMSFKLVDSTVGGHSNVFLSQGGIHDLEMSSKNVPFKAISLQESGTSNYELLAWLKLGVGYFPPAQICINPLFGL